MLVAAVGFFTASNIAASFMHGKLAIASSYDDVVYLLDGYQRRLAMLDQTFFATVKDFFLNPPHSPLSALLAMFGYSLFGPWLVSPYLMNSVLLIFYALSVFAVLRPSLGTWISITLVLGFLQLPISHAMVSEFRPDFGAALFFAVASFALIHNKHEILSNGERISLGVLAALAIAAKPSAVLITVPMLGFSGVVGIVLTVYRVGSLASGLRHSIPTLSTFLLLSGCFGYFWSIEIYDYLIQVFYTNADVWKTPGDTFSQWTYYSIGWMGTRALGPMFWPFLILILTDSLLLIQKRPDGFLAPLAYFLFVLIVYAGMSMTFSKTEFQASYFIWPFVIATVGATGRLLLGLSQFQFIHIGKAIVFPVVAAFSLLSPWSGQYMSRLPDGSKELLMKLVEAAVLKQNELLDLKCPRHTVNLNSFAPYPITSEAVALEGLMRNNLEIGRLVLYFTRSFEEQVEMMQSTDLLLFQSKGHVAISITFPGYAFYDQMADYLHAHPEWVPQPLPVAMGFPSTLYVKKGC